MLQRQQRILKQPTAQQRVCTETGRADIFLENYVVARNTGALEQ